MKSISLLPPEIKAKRKQEQKLGILLRVALVLFIIILVVNAYLLVASVMTRTNLENLRSERIALENQAAALEEYEVLYNEMNIAERRANQAMGVAPPWSNLMQDLGLILPQGVWLSDLNINFVGEVGSFSLLGWAYSHSYVADMLEEIEKMDQLSDVRVSMSTETIYNGQDAVQFAIDAAVLPGEPFLEVEEGVAEDVDEEVDNEVVDNEGEDS